METPVQNENAAPAPAAALVVVRHAPDWLAILRVILAGLYRLMVAGGALALVWIGGPAWIILAALPLLILSPRSR